MKTIYLYVSGSGWMPFDLENKSIQAEYIKICQQLQATIV